MPRITVEVESTIGSSIGRHDSPVPVEHDVSRAGGWPVGKGCVKGTLDTDGRSVRAMVLMQEAGTAGRRGSGLAGGGAPPERRLS